MKKKNDGCTKLERAYSAKNNQRQEYCFLSKKNTSTKKRKITDRFTNAELNTLKGLPAVDVVKGYGTTFHLSNDEIAFIQSYADRWQIPYENAVVKVVHDALSHLIETSKIKNDYI